MLNRVPAIWAHKLRQQRVQPDAATHKRIGAVAEHGVDQRRAAEAGSAPTSAGMDSLTRSSPAPRSITKRRAARPLGDEADLIADQPGEDEQQPEITLDQAPPAATRAQLPPSSTATAAASRNNGTAASMNSPRKIGSRSSFLAEPDSGRDREIDQRQQRVGRGAAQPPGRVCAARWRSESRSPPAWRGRTARARSTCLRSCTTLPVVDAEAGRARHRLHVAPAAEEAVARACGRGSATRPAGSLSRWPSTIGQPSRHSFEHRADAGRAGPGNRTRWQASPAPARLVDDVGRRAHLAEIAGG